MIVDVIESGSTGNCVALKNNGRIFLLEAGISWAKIARAIEHRFADIDGVFVSHEHKDHSKEAAMFCRSKPVVCSPGTASAVGLSGHYCRTDMSGEIGQWRYMQFSLFHDAEEPTGVYLMSGDEKIFFATDTYKITAYPRGVTRLIVECNYIFSALRENVESGVIEEVRARRVLRSHMSLESLVAWIKRVDRSCLKSVHLVHLSGDNAGAEIMKSAVARETGVPVYIGGC